MRIAVKVKFGQQLIVQPGDPLIITLTEPPEKGKANKQLIKALSDHYRVPASSVRLVSGAASRKKVIELLTLK